jgi:predicted DNA-binding protein (UPF0251 family)
VAEDHHQLLLLVAWEVLEYAEVALIVDVAIDTVMSTLNRARDRLRDHMTGVNGSSCGGSGNGRSKSDHRADLHGYTDGRIDNERRE